MSLICVTMAPEDKLTDGVRKAADSAYAIGATSHYLHPAGQIEDFSAARNKALQDAAIFRREGDWLVMIDDDEWLEMPHYHESDATISEVLGARSEDILYAKSTDGTYQKEKFFRVPVKGHFEGPTHECFVKDADATIGLLEGVTFSDTPKTAEQVRHKLERDNRILEQYVRQHPKDPRWWYYWGDTLYNLGEKWAALDAFLCCYNLDGWDEESAWASYRMAVIWSEEGKHDEAIHRCMGGIKRHAGVAELYWLAGFSSYQLGRYHQAIRFSKAAITFGAGSIEEQSRINFRYHHALTEGPWQVMEHSYRMLGDHDREVAARDHHIVW